MKLNEGVQCTSWAFFHYWIMENQIGISETLNIFLSFAMHNQNNV